MRFRRTRSHQIRVQHQPVNLKVGGPWAIDRSDDDSLYFLNTWQTTSWRSRAHPWTSSCSLWETAHTTATSSQDATNAAPAHDFVIPARIAVRGALHHARHAQGVPYGPRCARHHYAHCWISTRQPMLDGADHRIRGRFKFAWIRRI